MLINMATGNFKTRRIAFIVTGIIMVVLGIMGLTIKTVFAPDSDSGFIDGFYSGTGAGLVIAGLVFIVYYGFILNNPEKRKKAEIESQDERNRFISMKACQIACLITLFVQYAALLVSGIINMTAFYTILILMGVGILVTAIVWIVVRKIY